MQHTLNPLPKKCMFETEVLTFPAFALTTSVPPSCVRSVSPLITSWEVLLGMVGVACRNQGPNTEMNVIASFCTDITRFAPPCHAPTHALSCHHICFLLVWLLSAALALSVEVSTQSSTAATALVWSRVCRSVAALQMQLLVVPELADMLPVRTEAGL